MRAVWPGADRIGLAVSGGPDSLALLLMAHQALPGQFEVATVDHGLRAEGAMEAQAVADRCDRFGIVHATLRPAVGRSGNLQANARVARYAALGDWAARRGLAAILTAHHRDDQAETLVMRLNRGAGVRGLSAMRPAGRVPGHSGLPLLRPLLGWSRAELGAIVATAGLVPADDPSNRDPRFARAAIRRSLADTPWLDPAALAASAAHLAEADAALDWAGERIFADAEVGEDAIAWMIGETPRALALRVLERIIVHLGSGSPRGSELARWHDSLARGEIATLAGVRGDGREAVWRFTRARPHRDYR